MNAVEAEGRTVEEAVAVALRQLGVEQEHAEIEIVSQSTKGFLGIGGKRARVRASLRTPSEVTQESPPASPRRRRETRKESRENARQDPYAPSGRAVTEYLSEPGQESDQTAAPATALSPEFVERAGQLLREILVRMDIQTEVSSSIQNNEIVLNFEDVTDGLLIGRKGQTLDALEYLLNRIIAKNDDTEAHVLLDTAGYQERRRQNLENLAMRLGERAKRRRRTVTLSPLNPRDRRIIHLALEGDPLVATKSVGRGYLRRLSIVPEEATRRERGRGAARMSAE